MKSFFDRHGQYPMETLSDWHNVIGLGSLHFWRLSFFWILENYYSHCYPLVAEESAWLHQTMSAIRTDCWTLSYCWETHFNWWSSISHLLLIAFWLIASSGSYHNEGPLSCWELFIYVLSCKAVGGWYHMNDRRVQIRGYQGWPWPLRSLDFSIYRRRTMSSLWSDRYQECSSFHFL